MGRGGNGEPHPEVELGMEEEGRAKLEEHIARLNKELNQKTAELDLQNRAIKNMDGADAMHEYKRVCIRPLNIAVVRQGVRRYSRRMIKCASSAAAYLSSLQI